MSRRTCATARCSASSEPRRRPSAPSPTTVNTTASRFLGTRYVFNVVRTANHPASYTNQLNDVEKLIGVRTDGQSGPWLHLLGRRHDADHRWPASSRSRSRRPAALVSRNRAAV